MQVKPKSHGMCSRCGTWPSESGTATCERCAHERKLDYYYYKSLGICVSCYNREAMHGAVTCDECAGRKSAKKAARYWQMKNDAKAYRRYLDSQNERRRARVFRWSEAGLCTYCGKRPSAEGFKSCIDCRIANRRKYELNARKKTVARAERGAYGICYTCGKPNKEGQNVCEDCYARLAEMRAKANANPTPGMLKQREYWRRDNAIAFNRAWGGKNA